MSPDAMAAVLARLRELGCTADLIRDAEQGRIDALDLVRWVAAWRAERDRLRARGAYRPRPEGEAG